MSQTEDERLAAGGWIKHDGKGMPVALDADVMVRYADMNEQSGAAKWWRGWFWFDENDTANHITHYRVVTPTPAEAPTPPDTLTLRDQFAMAALPVAEVRRGGHADAVGTAHLAYAIADAMLAERAKK